MKKYFLLSVIGILGLSVAQAQITIKGQNMPTAGQNIIYSTSNDSIDVSETGPNHTWDFSKITPVSQDTYKYVSPSKANILYAFSFSGAVGLDMKLQGLNGAYSFFKTASTSYSQVGMGFTLPVGPKTPVPISYTNPDIIYKLPMTYGNSDDSCSFNAEQSITGFSIKITGKRHNTIDGWGKVTTPYKTYDCIRIKSVVTEMDTFLIIPLNRSRIEYKWLSISEMIPVMEADVTTGGGLGGGGGIVLHYRDSYKNIVNPNGPQVDFNVADTNVLTGDSIVFNNMTTGGLNYRWTIQPATFSYAAGTSATSKNPSVIFHNPGLYTVSLNSGNIAGTNALTKKDYINVTHNSGIAKNDLTNTYNIYPNPGAGKINMDFNASKATGVRLIFTDCTGKEIMTGTVSLAQGNTHLVYDISAWPSGMYFARVITEDGNSFPVQKLVVK